MTNRTYGIESSLHNNKLFLGGRWALPVTDNMVEVVSPATGEIIHRLPEVTVDDARKAVDSASAAFNDWSGATSETRIDVVDRFFAAFQKRLHSIQRIWAVETGMPVQLGEAFNTNTALIWEDIIKIARSVSFTETRDTPCGRVIIRHEGIGPTAAIMTYNGPQIELAMAVIPGLIAGNTFVVKLPPENQMLSYLLAEAAEEAGFPEGVISIFAAGTEVSKFLVSHPNIDAVHFTGGTEVGTEVIKSCAGRMARTTLELGGKSAAIVADDVDLETIIPQLIGGMTTFCGQICVAMTRILLPRSRHDEIVERLVEGFRSIIVGDPLDSKTQYGPLATERVRDRAEKYIEEAVTAGAQVAFGGKRPERFDRGWYLEPTLLTNIDNAMEVAQNEIFGPVFSVISYDDIDDAIRIANDSKYGLCGSVFTKDMSLAHKVAEQVRSGTFVINATFPCLTAPFGGMKYSGYGRESSRESLFELTDTKSILLPE
ncbi:aldehyde dehydrogenase [Sciscionella marina]|uniref:aldehyde dehydrogenase n=1 Tax=Sciscionella marina TaxID=508770 RepID=UPI00039E05DF|nr:aldehyde dehydrogenase [Sciscionella marina]